MLLPEQLATAHHEDLHARLALAARDGHQVHVQPRTPNDFLRFGHATNGDDAVAQTCGRFEVVVFRSRTHLGLQTRDQCVLLAFEKEHDLIDQAVVVVLRLVADARCQTTLDMVLQARSPAFTIDRLATRPQRKDRADEVDEFA